MPIDPYTFLFTIPVVVLVLFAPFIMAASWQGRPVAHLVHGYLGTTAVVMSIFAVAVLWENA